ncbi:MAG: DUF1801 domain-containing protein [Flavobacteriaceae bacterium]
MTDTENFIYQFEKGQREIMMYFHNLLTLDFNLSEKISFNLPFYYGTSWICYLKPTKKGTVEFSFVRGNELSNDDGLLKSKGRKQVHSIEIEKVKDKPRKNLNKIIHEAILLDQVKPYSVKKSK